MRGYLVATRITPSRRSASAAGSGPALRREHHRAAPEAEVEQLVDLAAAARRGARADLLEQHVLAGDAEVGGAGLDVGRHVRGAHRDHADRPRRAACGRCCAARRCRARGRRAGRRCPSNSAPRGTAIVSPLVLTALRRDRASSPARRAALLAGEREVQPVDAQREADRGQRAPEAAEQLVVAAAAADRRAERRVVDLEDGARVVADGAHEAEVEDHAGGDLSARAARGRGACPATASATGAGASCEHLWAAAPLRHLEQQLGRFAADASLGEQSARARRSRAARAPRAARREAARRTRRLSISAGNSEASPRPTR